MLRETLQAAADSLRSMAETREQRAQLSEKLLDATPELITLLDKAAEAAVIESGEPPRNPRDRAVVLAAAFLAGVLTNQIAAADQRPHIVYNRRGL